MITIYICDSFSLSMLDRSKQAKSVFRRIPMPIDDPIEEIEEIAQSNEIEIVSAIDDVDKAALFSKVLGMNILADGNSVLLHPNAVAIIGTTTLPDDAIIRWWLV